MPYTRVITATFVIILLFLAIIMGPGDHSWFNHEVLWLSVLLVFALFFMSLMWIFFLISRLSLSLYLRSFVVCSSVMFKRSVLDQVGLFDTDPDLIAIEDINLWLRIALKYKIDCADVSPFLHYRIQPRGISHGHLRKLRRALRLKRRYRKTVSNYLFCKSTILVLRHILKEMFVSLFPKSVFLNLKKLIYTRIFKCRS